MYKIDQKRELGKKHEDFEKKMFKCLKLARK